MPAVKQRRAVLTEEPLELGRIVITAGAKAVLSAEDVVKAISRHTHGDWVSSIRMTGPPIGTRSSKETEFSRCIAPPLA